MESLTLKTSTIFIATRDKTLVFRSLEEVPADLRRRLEKTASGRNSGVILIADRQGRVEVDRALRGLPSRLESPRLAAHAARQPTHRSAKFVWRLPPWTATALWLTAALGLLAWTATHIR